MKTILLALTLLATFATHAEARRHEVVSFDDLMDLTAGHLENLDHLQREAEKPFLEVAPRCLNHWPSYAAAYDRIHKDLASAAEPARRDILAYLAAAKDLDVGSPALTIEQACGPRGEAIHANIFRKRAALRQLAERLLPVKKEVNALFMEAWEIFETNAPAKDFGRNLSCLFKYQYVDVMRMAMFRDYDPHGERSPAPALYQVRDDLDRVADWADTEERELSDNLVRLNSLRMSCAP